MLGAGDRAMVFRSGPFEVYSSAGDKAARDTLNRLEQFRNAFGNIIGKPDLQTIWPVRVSVVRPAKNRSLPPNITLRRDVYVATLDGTAPLPRPFLRDLARLFLEAGAGPLPESIDRGLIDLFCTLEISGTHVTLGAPLPAAERNRDWARLHLLAVHPDYSGKLRVMLSNVQRGIDPVPAFRNAFEKTPAEIEKQLDAYMQAGQYGAIAVSGKAINAERDFTGKPAEPPAPGTKGAVDLVESGDFAGAARLNPRWAEPVYRMALAETDPARKLEGMKKAIALEPRNPKYREALATAMEQNKLAVEEAKRRKAEEERLALERLKDQALHRIREAEMKANEAGTPVDAAKVQDWWDGPTPSGKVRGILQRVDCLRGMARITVQPPNAKPVQLLVRDPGQVVIRGGGVTTLGCGPQKPARTVTVEYFPKPDPKLGTAGDAAVIEFQ